jgi:hypothetical protein
LSQANLPNITPSITITRDDAINLLLSSIALEELGLSHVINAEGEKLQFVLGTLPGVTGPTVTISDLLNVNDSVRETLKTVTQKELLLQNKLDSILTTPISVGPTGPAGSTGATGPIAPPNFAYLYSTVTQVLPPPKPGGEGGPVTFNNSVINSTAISFTPPASINILQTGFYRITWEVFPTAGVSAFGIFFGPGLLTLVPGSDYGTNTGNDPYTGQVIAQLVAGEVLTLNSILGGPTLQVFTTSFGNTVSASIIIEFLGS